MKRYVSFLCLLGFVVVGIVHSQDSTASTEESLIDFLTSSQRRFVSYRKDSDCYDINLLDEDAASQLGDRNANARRLQEQLNNARSDRDQAAMREIAQQLQQQITPFRAAKISRIGSDFIALREDTTEILIPIHRIRRVRIEE